jgi:hypothetical protein
MALVTALAIAVLVILMIREILAPQAFALCCVVVMVIAAAAWFLLLRSAKGTSQVESTMDSVRMQTHGKSKIFIVAGIVIFLPLSLWMTRGGPWLPRLIGASFLIALLIGNLLRMT